MRRNEGKARQGIDTTPFLCSVNSSSVVGMKAKPDRALTHGYCITEEFMSFFVEMKVKPDRALTHINFMAYKIKSK